MGRERAQVDLWHVPLPLKSDEASTLYKMLRQSERETACRIQDDARRHQFVVGRGLVRFMAAERTGLCPDRIPIVYGRYGKPYFALSGKCRRRLRCPMIHFNVAHTHGRIVVAMSRRGPVGVDVEFLHRDVRYAPLIERYFSPRERRTFRLASNCNKRLAFLKTWARKEAFVKAVGRGIAFGFHRFSVTVFPKGPPRLEELDGRAQAGAMWSFADFKIDGDFVGALCVRASCVDIHCRAVF